LDVQAQPILTAENQLKMNMIRKKPIFVQVYEYMPVILFVFVPNVHILLKTYWLYQTSES